MGGALLEDDEYADAVEKYTEAISLTTAMQNCSVSEARRSFFIFFNLQTKVLNY